MKKAIAALCLLACAACIFCSCGKGIFAFVSVRMKGNGNGTVTAVAQNEFALSADEMPVALSLYFSESRDAESELVESVEANLKFAQKVSFDYSVQSEGYFFARLEYTVDGETRFIQSDTVFYNTEGNRSAPR